MRRWLFALSLVVISTAALAERCIELVIGNSTYAQVSPLANPSNDARLMAHTLRKVGFAITEIHDAT